MNRPASAPRHGLLYGLAAYGLWGLVPAYFKALGGVPPLEILAHRVAWSVVFLGLVVTALRRWPDLLRCLRRPRLMAALGLSAVLITANWLVYIYGVATGRIVHTSLGYYITPLANVLFGLLVFGERLRAGQWAALALATTGVLVLVVAAGELPWIALCLPVSFGLYALVRKKAPVDSLLGLTIETALLLPAALAALAYWAWSGALSWGAAGRATDALLASSGVVTAVPLLCFGAAARRLSMSTLGFLQYTAPSLQFLQAVLFFGEPFTRGRAVSFGFIWAALAVYSLDSALAYRRAGESRPKGVSPGR